MKQWYVLQIYAGYEDKIKADLEYRIAHSPFSENFEEILFPSAKTKQIFSVEEEDQQLFPGYMLIKAELNPDCIKLVLDTPRVLRFLGGKTPSPLSRREVDRIFSTVKEGVVLETGATGLNEGDEVSISEGPFSGFVGVIEKVDPENERLVVMVSIFGRMTPIELKFDQVEK